MLVAAAASFTNQYHLIKYLLSNDIIDTIQHPNVENPNDILTDHIDRNINVNACDQVSMHILSYISYCINHRIEMNE